MNDRTAPTLDRPTTRGPGRREPADLDAATLARLRSAIGDTSSDQLAGEQLAAVARIVASARRHDEAAHTDRMVTQMVYRMGGPKAAVNGCENNGYRDGLRGLSRARCPYKAVWAVAAWQRGRAQAAVALAANLTIPGCA